LLEGEGVLSAGKTSARLGAGVRLKNLSRQLASQGLAFRNLPDVDKQSLAGAVSTATHGTGKNFGALSAEILSLKLMTAQGEVLRCAKNKNSDVFSAAKVSLGALGILTEIEMRLTPSYRLHRKTWFEPYDKLISRANALWDKHSTFEFYYLPFMGYCLGISHDPTTRPATPRSSSADSDGLAELMFLRDWFRWSSALRKRIGASAIAKAPTENMIGESYDLLSSPREVRFNEMEYHLPASGGLQALDEVKHLIEKNHTDIFFPIEVRYIKGDDAWLSPFQQGDRISIAVHAHYQDSYKEAFGAIEKIFRKYKGRPHWGKINGLRKTDFQALYPDWQKFAAIRKQLDPQGKFLNTYLRGLFT
jgi:FAD-linked oxidoreductase